MNAQKQRQNTSPQSAQSDEATKSTKKSFMVIESRDLLSQMSDSLDLVSITRPNRRNSIHDIICTGCEDGIIALCRCNDCDEVLCNKCITAHQRVKLTKNHRLRSLSNNVPFARSTNPLETLFPHDCQSSSEEKRLYCQTCALDACTDCVLVEHRNHIVIYPQQLEVQNKAVGVEVLNKCKFAIQDLHRSIFKTQRENDNFNMNMFGLIEEIKCVMSYYVDVIRDRQRVLVTEIEYQKCSGTEHFKNKKQDIKTLLSNINETIKRLDEALTAGLYLQLGEVNKTAMAHLKIFNELQFKKFILEGSNLRFIPAHPGFLKGFTAMNILSCKKPERDQLIRFLNTNGNAQRIRNKDKLVVHAVLSNFRIRENYYTRGFMSKAVFGSVVPVLVPSVKDNFHLGMFGGEGSEDGKLCRPWGIACDKNGNFLVSDRSNNRIQIFGPDGIFRRNFGSYGTLLGQFDRPAGIAVDSEQRIIVADKDNHRIQIFNNDGTFVRCFGGKGSSNGQFNYPWDVAVNGRGDIVVTDTRNHRIQLFNKEGTYLTKYGFEHSSSMWKHFDMPRGVCFTPNGKILVTDFNNHRVAVVNADFSFAQFLGEEGSANNQFRRPQGIACDDIGRIIVADARNSRIQVFDANGVFLWAMGGYGQGLGQFDRPCGVALTPGGRIATVDFANNRVQVF